MNIATSAILLALGVVLSYFLHAVASNEIFQSAFTEHPIHFILFFAPILLFCMISVSLGLSQSTLSNHTISILTIIPSVVITSVLVLAVQTIRPHPFSMLITYLVCQGLVFAVYFFITYQFNRARFLAEYEPREHLHYYAQGDRFWLSTFSYQLSIGLSLLALEAFSSDYVVGQYALILLFAIAYYSLLSPLYTFLSSHLDMHIETGPDILHPLLKRITKIQLFAVLVLGILSTIASPYIQALTPKGQDNFSTLVVFSCFLFSICMLTAPALSATLSLCTAWAETTAHTTPSNSINSHIPYSAIRYCRRNNCRYNP